MFHLTFSCERPDVALQHSSPLELVFDGDGVQLPRRPAEAAETGEPGIDALVAEPHLYQERVHLKTCRNAFSVLPLQRSHLLYLVAVPSFMSLWDLIGFFHEVCSRNVKAEEALNIQAIRLILRPWDASAPSDFSPTPPASTAEDAHGGNLGAKLTGFYSVVLVFKSQLAADRFYQNFHGRLFPAARSVLLGGGTTHPSQQEVQAPSKDGMADLGVIQPPLRVAFSSPGELQHSNPSRRASEESCQSLTLSEPAELRSRAHRGAAPDASLMLTFEDFANSLAAKLVRPSCYLVFLSTISYDSKARLEIDAAPASIACVPGVAPSECTELPTCPVCLERLDVSVCEILTQSNSWDSNPSLWAEDCPACSVVEKCRQISSRKEQPTTPRSGTHHPPLHLRLRLRHAYRRSKTSRGDTTTPPEECQTCPDCMHVDDCWVCLICGHTGCGRYKGGHAVQHAETTKHEFALHISTARIWGYRHEAFVHRRLAQQALIAADWADAGGEGKEEDFKEKKVEEARSFASMELDVVLASQLEYQRQFQELQLEDIRRDLSADIEKADVAIGIRRSNIIALKGKIEDWRSRKKAVRRRLHTQEAAHAKAREDLQWVSDLRVSLLEAEGRTPSSSRRPDPHAKRYEKSQEAILALRKEVDDLLGQL